MRIKSHTPFKENSSHPCCPISKNDKDLKTCANTALILFGLTSTCNRQPFLLSLLRAMTSLGITPKQNKRSTVIAHFMAKSKLIFLILIVLSKLSFSQKLIDNSIGVVYVMSENNKTYELKIVVPLPFLKEFQLNKSTYEFKLVAGEFDFPDKILLFDESGVFDTLKTQEKWKIRLWCENDGGIQYRPENHVIIEKNSIRKKLIKIAARHLSTWSAN